MIGPYCSLRCLLLAVLAGFAIGSTATMLWVWLARLKKEGKLPFGTG